LTKILRTCSASITFIHCQYRSRLWNSPLWSPLVFSCSVVTTRT
jgi:hypothetical protein